MSPEAAAELGRNIMSSLYQYALELYDETGVSLGQKPMTVDWEPAEEWTRLLAIRKGELPPSGSQPKPSVKPRWNPELGQPYISGFRVGLVTDGGREFASDFTSVYFREQAQRASSELVARGKLKQGEKFQYAVTAFPIEETPKAESGHRFHVEEVSPPLPLRDGALEDLLHASAPRGTLDEEDLPVFVPGRILAEAAALARKAGAKETGGILVGHLHRDARLPEVFAVVEAQIPASHARGELTSLTFTAETWTEIKAVVDLRGKDEIFLGWWHSHPVHRWECKNCPIERRRRCPLANDFLSGHDRALHRTVFPRAYSVALVVNQISDDERTYSFFGWRRGLLQPRGFYVLNGADEGPEDGRRPRAA